MPTFRKAVIETVLPPPVSAVTVFRAEYFIALETGRVCVDSYAIYGICSLLVTDVCVCWDPWTVGKLAGCPEVANKLVRVSYVVPRAVFIVVSCCRCTDATALSDRCLLLAQESGGNINVLLPLVTLPSVFVVRPTVISFGHWFLDSVLWGNRSGV